MLLKIIQWFKPVIKPWTILIYANGNNDLEPEISQSLLDIERIGTGKNVNVIVQLARAPAKFVQTFRPHYSWPTDIDGDWNGVRRYRIKNHPHLSGERDFHSELLADLGNVNMADPAMLRDFICWGVKIFPTRHYMLILMGHGAGIAGALPDYTFDCPQIMSINGIKAAINQATKETGRKIDVLVFDSCYMNMVEIIYELGIGAKSPDFIITSEVTPLEGLPYETIMEVLKSISEKDPPQTLIRKLVTEVNRVLAKKGITLFILRTNQILLWFIKKTISNIARLIVKNNIDLYAYTNPSQPELPACDLDKLTKVLEAKTNNFPILVNIRVLKKCINFIILPQHTGESKSDDNASLSIYLPNNNHFLMIEKYYTRMQFIHNNQWLKILSNNPISSNFITRKNQYALPKPDNLPLEGIRHVITTQNPGLSLWEINAIIETLGWSNCQSFKTKEPV